MIVRDEEPIIKRCLDSVSPLTDCWVICDTGSVDRTKETIQDYFNQADTPGHLIENEWDDFGVNKTYIIQKAQELYPNIPFFFIIDADEVFVRKNKTPIDLSDREALLKFCNENPQHSVIQFITYYGTLEYPRWQVMRNDRKYRWDYPYHELLASTPGYSQTVYNGMFNWARKEGNSSRDPNRTQWYVKKGYEYLEKHPDDPRMTFYLGQSLYEARMYEEAIKVLMKRSDIRVGYDQERFIAMIYAFRCCQAIKDSTQALEIINRAIREFPKRLEGYYEKMKFYDEKSDHKSAFEAGRAGPYNENSAANTMLFKDVDVWNYKHKFQLGLICYYVNEYELGVELLTSVLPVHPTPDFVHKQLKHFDGKTVATQKWSGVTKFKMYPPTITVIDNFLENPDALRDLALKADYSVKGNYPGFRSQSFATDAHKQIFEKILGKKIVYWPDGYNGSFQYVTGQGRTWWHRDNTDYSAMIFLSPNPIPNSGTSIFVHKELRVSKQTPETKAILDKDSNNADAWELVDCIGNKYNRLVIFDGKLSHRDNDYFGDSLETARLFQIFFFDVEKS
jgi:glycosyltransferase involved in cell wall biosynthesis